MDIKSKALIILSLLVISVNPLWAKGDIAAGKIKSTACSACHGLDGNSANNIWPNLAGQHAKYLLKQMIDFKKGKNGGRYNAVMNPLVAHLSKQDMEDIAAYYASQTVKLGTTDKSKLALGRRVYRGGDLSRQIAACSACHGPRGQGVAGAGFPALSGQHAEYTGQQLLAFRDGLRSNSPSQIMASIAHKMTKAEMEAVASYVASLH